MKESANCIAVTANPFWHFFAKVFSFISKYLCVHYSIQCSSDGKIFLSLSISLLKTNVLLIHQNIFVEFERERKGISNMKKLHHLIRIVSFIVLYLARKSFFTFLFLFKSFEYARKSLTNIIYSAYFRELK